METLAPAAALTPPLKYHGGKHYLARRIIAAMPSHTHYVESFAGGAAVLLAKDAENVSEVLNDLDGQLTNFWWVLRDDEAFAAFHRRCEAAEFSEPLFAKSEAFVRPEIAALLADPAHRAFWFFVHCRQSMAGRRGAFTPVSRTRTRRGMNEQASAWIAAVDGLPAVHARLRRVVVMNKPAVEVIRQQDGPATMHYVDPPYVPESRAAANVYAHEMAVDQHVELLDTLTDCSGKVMLSGYDNALYRDRLADWHRLEFDLPNNAAGGAAKRRMTEVVWCNFTPRPAADKGGHRA